MNFGATLGKTLLFWSSVNLLLLFFFCPGPSARAGSDSAESLKKNLLPLEKISTLEYTLEIVGDQGFSTAPTAQVPVLQMIPSQSGKAPTYQLPEKIAAPTIKVHGIETKEGDYYFEVLEDYHIPDPKNKGESKVNSFKCAYTEEGFYEVRRMHGESALATVRAKAPNNCNVFVFRPFLLQNLAFLPLASKINVSSLPFFRDLRDKDAVARAMTGWTMTKTTPLAFEFSPEDKSLSFHVYLNEDGSVKRWNLKKNNEMDIEFEVLSYHPLKLPSGENVLFPERSELRYFKKDTAEPSADKILRSYKIEVKLVKANQDFNRDLLIFDPSTVDIIDDQDAGKAIRVPSY